MLEKCYEELTRKINLRENLSRLRNAVKEEENRRQLSELAGDGKVLIGLLTEEEPKVRKNAALLLGDLGIQAAAAPLFHAYNNETTLFVRSSYLTALGKLDASEYLEAFQAHLKRLTGCEPEESEKKHIREEIRELERIVTGIKGISRHTFSKFQTEKEFLLTTNKGLQEVTAAEIKELPMSVRRNTSIHPLGVLVRTKEPVPFFAMRTYRELLFPLHTKEAVKPDPACAAAAVWDAGVLSFLEECHEQGAPFYFRLELRNHMELDKKSVFAKRFSVELEERSKRRLINAPGDYEVEIRLIERKDGSLAAFLKLFTLPEKRFAYRKGVVSGSMHPSLAAALVRLAKPWLLEDAQILDPFCGVGTMLIERDICVPAREKYGIDVFGDAVAKARENTSLAGEQINYINRDYFDFRHAYLFDEIITDMPPRGKRSREETDRFYEDFFRKSREILAPEGILILYSNEEGFIKKQIRLNPDYKLQREFVIRKKDSFSLFIIKKVSRV